MTPLINLVLSDTHCGSDCGLLPPSVELDDGTTIGHGKNKRMRWLWESFVDMQARFHSLCNGDPYILTINGDVIEGIHHRTEEVVAAKIMEHLTIAREALGNLIRGAAKVVITRGTECHVRDLETVFAKEFGVSKALDVQQYTVNGCLVDARHHMPVTGRMHLEASALSISMANTRSNMTRSGHPLPKVFIRGHRHVMGDYCDGESMILVCGAWQHLTRHGNKVVPDSIPRPSAYALDWRGTAKGALPATHRFVYSPPHEVHLS
jgi:hypothetical protein